ncbi:unnamed protein product, partial [Effrenium voratum]
AELGLQVDRLRSENQKLRELLIELGLELPSADQGGAVRAAETLVSLMTEGGSLVREREELILEHARLTVAQQAAEDQDPDLEQLLQALLEVDALNAEREQLRMERGLQEQAEADELVDALSKLRPLLSETDVLRTERQRLVSERRSLAEVAQGAGVFAEEVLEDEDLELQLLNAVK